MNVYAVISEFNPFHNGHEYLINTIKAKDPDAAIVAIMSGSFVERGDAAIVDKYARAEAAVRCGVDLVLELPAPWCFSGAEFFARGGVAVADGIAVADTLVFGSECGDITELCRVADGIMTDEYAAECEAVRAAMPKENAAVIRSEAYARLYEPTSVFIGSNNLLALEYIKSARKCGSKLKLMTVKRVGESYNSENLTALCSATAIRKAIFAKNGGFMRFMPEASAAVLCRELDEGRMYDLSRLDTAVIAMLLCDEPEKLSAFMEVDGGIEYRLCNEALTSRSIAELTDKVKSRRYSESRVRRAILSCILGVTMRAAGNKPLFTNLLAANSLGREVLVLAKKRSKIAILSKYSDAKELSGEAAAQYELHRRAERLCELCCHGEPRRVGAVMI